MLYNYEYDEAYADAVLPYPIMKPNSPKYSPFSSFFR